MTRPETAARRAVALLAATAGIALAAGSMAGCGVPATSDPQVLSTTSVPYNLLSNRPGTPTPSAGSTSGQFTAQVAFVDGDAHLRLLQRRVRDGRPAEITQELLDQLRIGPSEIEHRSGLGSAIPSGAGLRVTQVADRVATIDLAGAEQVQAPDRIPLAVAQIVFTVTSVPTVSAVRLLRDGVPVDAPRPGGTLTSAPLTRQDYVSLLSSAP
jgi:spore germination protein GerM